MGTAQWGSRNHCGGNWWRRTDRRCECSIPEANGPDPTGPLLCPCRGDGGARQQPPVRWGWSRLTFCGHTRWWRWLKQTPALSSARGCWWGVTAAPLLSCCAVAIGDGSTERSTNCSSLQHSFSSNISAIWDTEQQQDTGDPQRGAARFALRLQ